MKPFPDLDLSVIPTLDPTDPIKTMRECADALSGVGPLEQDVAVKLQKAKARELQKAVLALTDRQNALRAYQIRLRIVAREAEAAKRRKEGEKAQMEADLMRGEVEAARIAMQEAQERFRHLEGVWLTTDRAAGNAFADAEHLISSNERPLSILARLEGRPEPTRRDVQVVQPHIRSTEEELALLGD